MPDSCAVFGYTNRRSTTSLQFYCRTSERRMKWVTAMRKEKWPAKKTNNAQICNVYSATNELS